MGNSTVKAAEAEPVDLRNRKVELISRAQNAPPTFVATSLLPKLQI
jgi:hypothetical protein